ncbi:MAG: N-acetylneuraminate synthase family protein [Nitrospinae bacterium]|nr:N-acetylneuraminate synthase family protein [Nitrospinota bacterium]
MKIDTIDLEKEVLIIAEIGNNHEGDFSLAKKMISAAARAGAHAVKFQTIVPERFVAPSQKGAFDLFSKFRFNYEQFAQLKETADGEGVVFLSTPFDIDSARFLNSLVPAFKIASGDNNFWPLIETVARTGKPILLSAGMANSNEILRAKWFIENLLGPDKTQSSLAVLHCISLYPTPPGKAHLLSIPALKQRLGVTVGYSDHTIGTDAAVLAVALGARVIEKHFTLDKNYSDFPDHRISMDPRDLAQLVEKIAQAGELLGTASPGVGAEELEVAKVARRSIAASRDLAKGTRLEWDHLTWLRPGNGLAPGEEGKVLGKILKSPVPKGNRILPEDLEN